MYLNLRGATSLGRKSVTIWQSNCKEIRMWLLAERFLNFPKISKILINSVRRDMHRMHLMITGPTLLIFNSKWTEPTGVKSLIGELKLSMTWWTHICLVYTASLVHGDFLKPGFIKDLLPRTTICSTVPSLTTHGYWEDPRLQTSSPTDRRRTGTII